MELVAETADESGVMVDEADVPWLMHL
jgi:hypothetical protein